ncbi:transporter [Adlercreutzia sp. R25]|uniref:transporter n=1 Tax=Adlercreutzia shanghongiae TaxID=3111773 RepID=UPI002DBCB65E|nr:transporter [Adlercreutzia sp. R25]MEC4273287.1 transporter [Adlercreutzia sp. R25]
MSKLAAGVSFLSWEFVGLYAGIIALLGLYAIGWQQILRRMPLTTAFSNKAVTIVWGIVWGALFFSESITLGKVIGALFIIAGVILFSHADSELPEKDAGSKSSGSGSSGESDIVGSEGVVIDG